MQLAKTALGINPNALDKLDSQLMGAEVNRHSKEWYTALQGKWEL